MEPYQVNYLDFYDDACYTLNLSRFKKLSDSQRNTLQQCFLKVLCRHSEYLPSMTNSTELGILERPPPYSGHTFTKFCQSLKEYQRKSNRVSVPEPIKIELGCLPTPDFMFSQNPINLPEVYESNNEESEADLNTQQFPVNVLFGNVNIFKYFNAIRYLGQPPPTVSTLSPQVPMQSYITYLWGAAIDQYYQVALQNNFL
uniref:Uncharacterized protein n=1 Tax=Rhodnius prolixus TaxID=13249 RepID=T1HKN0_RHOPR